MSRHPLYYLSRFAVTLGILSLVKLSVQAAPTVEERLKALEEQVQSLATENAQLKQQLGWKDAAPSVLPQPGGKETKLVVGGFLQAQAEFGRAADPRWNGVKDRFFFRRAPARRSFALHASFGALLCSLCVTSRTPLRCARRPHAPGAGWSAKSCR